MKGELFRLYKVLSVSRSTANVDLVSMIGTIVFKGAECTSGIVTVTYYTLGCFSVMVVR